jgi:hypothetical protein
MFNMAAVQCCWQFQSPWASRACKHAAATTIVLLDGFEEMF